MRAPSRIQLSVLAVLALVFGAAPTVGDIGSCNTPATPLDVAEFAAQRKAVDCQKCQSCGFQTMTCKNACNPNAPSDVSIPSTCFPLAHDGQVCLDALEATSCSGYASFVSDTDPTQPSECQFCLDVPDGGS
jgi:hypothetical protein